MSAPETDSGPAAEPVVVEPKHPLEDPRPLGVHILTWLAWFWTGAVLLFLHYREGSSAPAEAQAWIAPAVTPGGGYVAAGLRF